MKPTAPEVLALVEAARFAVKQGQLPPIFYIGNSKEVAVVGAFFETAEDKDNTAKAVRKMVEKMQATFVLFIAESWSLSDPEAALDYMNNRDKYKSVSDHPKAVEIVAFTLETLKEGDFMGIAPIGAGRVLGDVRWMENPDVEGRFTKFMGDKPVTH